MRSGKVLIAMASRDPIVLAKLVHSLQPQALLLLQSPKAAREHWMDALLAHWRMRPDLLPQLHSATVDDRQMALFVRDVRDAWATLCAGIEPSAVLVDTTTGMGLHRAVLAECLSTIATRAGIPAALVYCDSDRGVVRGVQLEAGNWLEADTPIDFRLGNDPLAERLAPHGFQPDEIDAQLIWLDGHIQSDWPQAAWQSLYQGLMDHAALRDLMSGLYELIRRWRLGKLIEEQTGQFGQEPFRALLTRSVAELPEPLAGRVRAHLAERHAADRSADRFLFSQAERLIRNELNPQSSIVQCLDAALVPLPREPRRVQAEALTQQVMAHWHPYFDGLQQLYQRHRASLDSVPRRDIVRAFMDDYLSRHRLGQFRKVLFQGKIGALLETAVSAAVVAALQTYPAATTKVRAVYHNVKLRRSKLELSEIDTLILWRNGDVSIIETKSHFSNADVKDIEARIKTWRDHLGAYTRGELVFPWTAAELDLLRRGMGLGREICQQAEWSHYVRTTLQSRDRHILGINQLAEGLRLTPAV